MSLLDEFSEILRRDEPLAPYTWLKVGGPAQFFLTPRSGDELQRVVVACHQAGLPLRVLGGGSNILVKDDGVGGAVVRLSDPAFSQVAATGTRLRAGAGALLSQAIAESIRSGLAGMEVLAGIPGTVGGAVRGNAGGRQGDLSELVECVDLLTSEGIARSLPRDELQFEYRDSNLKSAIVLAAVFQLTPDDGDRATQRLRQIWITKKASQPLSSQSAGCIFKNPRGEHAGALIDRAGLKGTRIGGAEVSDRHANFIVTHEGATSDDVLRLIDLIRSKVSEQFSVSLETEIDVW